MRSRRRTAVTTAIPAAMMAMPATAVPTNPALGSPWRTRMASAMTGSTSLNDMFAKNVANADSAIWDFRNPHDVYIAYETPTAMAPPPGTVMATVVDDWQTTAAWASERPGMAATSIGQ